MPKRNISDFNAAQNICFMKTMIKNRIILILDVLVLLTFFIVFPVIGLSLKNTFKVEPQCVKNVPTLINDVFYVSLVMALKQDN